MTSARWPRLFIVGAPRSGTTFLSEVVGSHSNVFVCDMKEPHYFGHPASGFEYSGPGDNWVNRTWIDDEETYLALFCGRKEHVLCDASTNTMYWPAALAEIEAREESAIYVCVLRDPVDRIESMFFRHRAQGLESCSGVLDAITEECAGERASWSPGFRYLEQSRYFEHVSRLTATAGDRCLIFTFDEVKDEPLHAARMIWSRCGLEYEEVEVPSSRNATPHFSNPLLRALLVRPLALRTIAAKIAPEPLVRWLLAMRRRRTGQAPALTSAERAALRKLVADDARRTEELVGKRILRTAP